MECLIKRTKHKCKRCTRLFSNEAALKQHYCEPPNKMQKFTHCSKTTIRPNNLEKYLRSCEKAPTHTSKQQIHQTTLDELTSLKNWLSTPKKLMVKEVQKGGASAGHAEHWLAFKLIESTLKYRAVNRNNKRDILKQLKEVIHSMISIT